MITPEQNVDLSIRVTDGDYNWRQTIGTPEDILRSARCEAGKALNGLDFPVWNDWEPRNPCASELVAWYSTTGMPFCRREITYPTYPMKWSLISTGGTYHTMHSDSEGFGTIVGPLCGIKIWYIAVPKQGEHYDAFADIDVFGEDFDIS